MCLSPTICQMFVQEALKPLRERFPCLLVVHYTDDILICHEDLQVLKEAYPLLVKSLQLWDLQIAAKKVQIANTGQFLGSVILPEKILPQKIVPRYRLASKNHTEH